jgi:predicted transposase YbfD/YdcC
MAGLSRGPGGRLRMLLCAALSIRADAGPCSVARVRAEWIVDAHRTIQVPEYLSSLPADAARQNTIVRTHWQIENGMHWVLEVFFDEDQNRVRIGYAQHNPALSRPIALSLLNQDTAIRARSKTRPKHAGWDDANLLHILTK